MKGSKGVALTETGSLREQVKEWEASLKKTDGREVTCMAYQPVIFCTGKRGHWVPLTLMIKQKKIGFNISNGI